MLLTSLTWALWYQLLSLGITITFLFNPVFIKSAPINNKEKYFAQMNPIRRAARAKLTLRERQYFNPGHSLHCPLSDPRSMLSVGLSWSVTTCWFHPLIDVYISEIILPQLQYNSPLLHPSHECGLSVFVVPGFVYCFCQLVEFRYHGSDTLDSEREGWSCTSQQWK